MKKETVKRKHTNVKRQVVLTPKVDFTNPQFDYVDWTLFDTLCIHPNQEMRDVTNMFVEPIGTRNGDKLKTEVDTNMHQGGMLYAPFEFTVFGVQLTKILDNHDTTRLIRNHLVQIWILNKLYFESPLIDLPRRLNCVLELKCNDHFSVKILGRLFDREDTIKLRLTMNGRMKRGIW